ncbi:MAG: GNAT family N-acetyltransferase [Alphaproteobacteria bacterium]|nr:GNAT family N-acetyltransferase [Alphaproteobacteria bacterium]
MPIDDATPMPMIIRDAERAEFPALAALQIRSWRDVYRGIMPDAYLDDEIEEDLHARWEALRPSGDDLVLVADQDGIRGFVTVWCRPDPYIDNLHVDPGERSNGIGCRLMQTVAHRLGENGFGRMSLYVAAQNHRAAAFYGKLGGRFGEVEQVHQQFGGPVDAIEVVWDDLTKMADVD